jgi:midasin (ATPase involved in ribosome maturation)
MNVVGHKLVRINLSEQTDMMDLLGADLPAEGGAAGAFVWSDGPLLAALRSGDWVLLDELNLAGRYPDQNRAWNTEAYRHIFGVEMGPTEHAC